ncbi:hypothetical protein [Paenibacillus thalictri]|uniref:Uncharacterized protein n=1 Tax=Paenibacillus thalictri TaxID=2527873 RepID=A0A4Q9DWM0_9BACL|nr:hypothetical protein [Paenibacillus thalictri]TBL80232.1 hypothetical protein EYB31_07385 [Paenibacillus thalictri]
MDFTSQDIAVIEQALRIAIQSEGSNMKQSDYREVLWKLQNNSAEAIEREPSADNRIVSSDGLRFDYDDSSEML